MKLFTSALLAAAALSTAVTAVRADITPIGSISSTVAGDVTVSGTIVAVIDVYAAASKNTFIISDGTGYVLAYSVAQASYTAAPGDVVTLTSKNSPYNGAPELTNTDFTLVSATTGNPAPSPVVVTATELNAGATASGSISEGYVTLKGVTFPAGTTSISTTAKANIIMTDSSGVTSILYNYYTYSGVSSAIAAANANPSIFAGPVDITGYVSPYTSGGVTTYEIYPTSITASAAAVPEPASLGLIGLGAVGLLARRRK